jgi:hypothetical protein
VLTALAAGRWVVTRRYVDRSHKTGEWANPRGFVCHPLVLTHRERHQQAGGRGCFADMRVLFLMENTVKRSVYANVVRAGSGSVVDSWSLDDLLTYKPGRLFFLIFIPLVCVSVLDPNPDPHSMGSWIRIQKSKISPKSEKN